MGGAGIFTVARSDVGFLQFGQQGRVVPEVLRISSFAAQAVLALGVDSAAQFRDKRAHVFRPHG